jgi:hypothetical protein
MRVFLLFACTLALSNAVLGCTSEDCGGVDAEDPPEQIPISVSIVDSRHGAKVSTSGQCTQASCSYQEAGECMSWSAMLTAGASSSCTVTVTDPDGNQESQPATAGADGCTGEWGAQIEFPGYSPGTSSVSSASGSGGAGGAAGSGGTGGSGGGTGGAGGGS